MIESVDRASKCLLHAGGARDHIVDPALDPRLCRLVGFAGDVRDVGALGILLAHPLGSGEHRGEDLRHAILQRKVDGPTRQDRRPLHL